VKPRIREVRLTQMKNISNHREVFSIICPFNQWERLAVTRNQACGIDHTREMRMIRQSAFYKKEQHGRTNSRVSSKHYVFSAGALIGGILAASSASASNGFSYFITCAACVTSGDFNYAATNIARSQQRSGLYIVTSATNPETAYVQITGQLQNVWKTEVSCLSGVFK